MQCFLKLMTTASDIFKHTVPVIKQRALRHQVVFQNYSIDKTSLNYISFSQKANKKIFSFHFSHDVFPPSCKPFIWYPKIQEPAATPAIIDLSAVHFQTRKPLRQNFPKMVGMGIKINYHAGICTLL